MTMRALEGCGRPGLETTSASPYCIARPSSLWTRPRSWKAFDPSIGLVVVAENHSIVGGLGEAVASTLLRHRVQPAAFQLAGLPDQFLDAGALPTLHDRYGISRAALAHRIKGWL
jgi:transketolase